MTGRSKAKRRAVLKTIGAGIVSGTAVAGSGTAEQRPTLWKADLVPVGSESDGAGTAHFKRDPAGPATIDFTVDAHRLEGTPTGAHVHEGEDNVVALFNYGTPTTADDMLRIAGSFSVSELNDPELDGARADVHTDGLSPELEGTIRAKEG